LSWGASITKKEPEKPRTEVIIPKSRFSITSLKNFARRNIKNIVNIDEIITTIDCMVGSENPAKKSKTTKFSPAPEVSTPALIAKLNEIPVNAENIRILGNPMSFHQINIFQQNKIL